MSLSIAPHTAQGADRSSSTGTYAAFDKIGIFSVTAMIHELETDRLKLRQWRSSGSRFGLGSSSTTMDCSVTKIEFERRFL